MTDNRTNEQIVAEAFTRSREPEYHISETEDMSDAVIAVTALRAAGRLAGEPSEAQVEAAAEAIWDAEDAQGNDLPWAEQEAMFKRHWRSLARAALAAAGVAPQAESENLDQALGFLDHLNQQNHIDWTSYSRLHDLISAITPAVRQVSESDLAEKAAEVLRSHAPRMDQTACYDGWCICGWTGDEIEHSVHQARAVVAALGGESQ